MRIALCIEYDGTDFLGWQAQAHGPSLQAAVERAVSFVANAPTEVVCAGRTDTGVHARGQIVHFDTQAQRDERAWTLGINSGLPRTVAVLWAKPVSDDFHARYAAVARHYRYTILNRAVRPALDARFVTWERLPLDVQAMHTAAQAVIGEHDFTSFRTVHCQAHSPMRRMESIEVVRDGERVHLHFRANAFLHHMVRNLVGSLLPIGRGEKPVTWLRDLLAARDRNVAGPTAAASGLTFLGPLYPATFGLPPAFTAEPGATRVVPKPGRARQLEAESRE
jgi:tRNA pseudouridine38-40 synthase